MLESLSILCYRNLSVNTHRLGKKATSADNQQERLKTIGWVIGFVDEEIAMIAQTMNRKKPARFLESSETIRQTRQN